MGCFLDSSVVPPIQFIPFFYVSVHLIFVFYNTVSFPQKLLLLIRSHFKYVGTLFFQLISSPHSRSFFIHFKHKTHKTTNSVFTYFLAVAGYILMFLFRLYANWICSVPGSDHLQRHYRARLRSSPVVMLNTRSSVITQYILAQFS